MLAFILTSGLCLSLSAHVPPIIAFALFFHNLSTLRSCFSFNIIKRNSVYASIDFPRATTRLKWRCSNHLGICYCCTNLLQHGLFRLKHSSWPSGIPIVPASILLADPWASTAASFLPLCRIAVPRPLRIITQPMIQVMHPGLPINITLGPPTLVTLHLMLLSSDIPLISLRPPCHLDLSGTPKGKLIRCNQKSRNRTKSYIHLQEDSVATWLEHTRPPGSDRSRSSWRRTEQATWVLLQWNRWSC